MTSYSLLIHPIYADHVYLVQFLGYGESKIPSHLIFAPSNIVRIWSEGERNLKYFYCSTYVLKFKIIRYKNKFILKPFFFL